MPPKNKAQEEVAEQNLAAAASDIQEPASEQNPTGDAVVEESADPEPVAQEEAPAAEAHPNASEQNPTGASAKLHEDTIALLRAAKQECVDILALIKEKIS